MPLPLTLTTEIIRWNESQPVSLLWVEQLKQNWNIKFARRDQNFPGILRCALNTILFPLFFLDPFPNYSCILSTMCETLLSNLQYLKMRTSSWPYSVRANFRNYALCYNTDVHFLFVHSCTGYRLQKKYMYIALYDCTLAKWTKTKCSLPRNLLSELSCYRNLSCSITQQNGVVSKLNYCFCEFFSLEFEATVAKYKLCCEMIFIVILWNDFHHEWHNKENWFPPVGARWTNLKCCSLHAAKEERKNERNMFLKLKMWNIRKSGNKHFSFIASKTHTI